MPPRVAKLPLGEDERLLVQHVELGVHVPRVQRPEHLSKSILHCKNTFFAAKMHFLHRVPNINNLIQFANFCRNSEVRSTENEGEIFGGLDLGCIVLGCIGADVYE